MRQAFVHEPVMVGEVVELFAPVPAGVVVDATVGGGGHAEAILDAYPRLRVVGLDRDPDAVSASRSRLARFEGRFDIRHARFDAGGGAAHSAEHDVGPPRTSGDTSGVAGAVVGMPVSGVLFDLGVSSPHLDRAERGFSYRLEGPLDMRMDPTRGATAAQIVNDLPEQDLVRLLAVHGEGRFARRIARAIVAARPLSTTRQLAEVVSGAVPAAGRRRGHPARRVFQALRVTVNEELDHLGLAIADAIDIVAPAGRVVVIAYHSGEDRIVKATFARAVSGGCTCPRGLPCTCGARGVGRLVFRGAKRPSAEEIARNHRAESARLRAFERTAEDGPKTPGPDGSGDPAAA